MRRARTFPPFLCLSFILIPATARADYGAALAAVDAAQAALDDARARRDGAVAELHRTLESIPGLEQWLAGAPQRIDEAAAVLATHDAELADRRAARDEADRRARDSAAVVQRIHDAAWSAYRQRPEFVAAERDMAGAQARVDATVEEVHERLAGDREYRRLADDARAAEEFVESLRDDPRADPNERAAASQRWLDAKRALQRYRDETLATDPALHEARVALEDAARRRRELLDVFDASLDADPQMRDARAVLDAAEIELAAAEEALRQTTIARDAADRTLRQLEAQRAEYESQLAGAHQRADDLRRAIDAAEADVRYHEDALSCAVAALQQAARDYEAELAYRDAIVHFDDHHTHRRSYHDQDRHRDRHHDDDDDKDRGKRYERRDRSHPDRKSEPPPTRDSSSPRLIDEEERERARKEAEQQQADARRGERERREAEWQKRREENKRRQEENEKNQASSKVGPQPQPKVGPEPQPKVGPQPAPKVGPQPAPPREDKPREAKKQDSAKNDDSRKPAKSDQRKDDSSKDRGDRYRKGK